MKMIIIIEGFLMNKVNGIFKNYLKTKNLKHSEQRKNILNTFMASGQHLTTEELYSKVRGVYANIGYATVHRTLKLLVESGVCRETRLDDGISRFEIVLEHDHHDHLICTKCGLFIEVVDPKIEELQMKLTQKHDFSQEYHRLTIYGVCKSCGIKEKE